MRQRTDGGIPKRIAWKDPQYFVSNAIKFTERGEVVLAVTTQASSDSTMNIEFEVRDTGIGMSAEQLSRVFTPFGQAASNKATRRSVIDKRSRRRL